MTDAGKRFMNWLMKNKNITCLEQYLAMTIGKRIELRKEWQAAEEAFWNNRSIDSK